MEKVVQTSQNDFEESGVDHSTLDEMKQVCCNLTDPGHRACLSFVAAPLSRSVVIALLVFPILSAKDFLALFSLAAAIARWPPGLGVMGG
jgi:hypothetical protein